MRQTFPPPTPTSEALIKANLGLARKAANAWHRKTQQPYDDLLSLAYVGLVRGCRKYDPERLNPANGQPYALSTIVMPFINGEILHHFRDRGYAIKFPSRWREQWGKIQRLMDDPTVSTAEVAERAGMTVEQLSEMLSAMAAPANLDDLHGADGTPGPEIELQPLGPLQLLIRQAWDKLHPADQRLLVRWWGDQRRQAYPSGPLQQFHRRLKALLGGQTFTRYQQTALVLEVDRVKSRQEHEREALERYGLEAPAELRRRRRVKPQGQVELLAV